MLLVVVVKLESKNILFARSGLLNHLYTIFQSVQINLMGLHDMHFAIKVFFKVLASRKRIGCICNDNVFV